MKVKIDKMPTKPQECLFSDYKYPTGFVCKLANGVTLCNVETCKYLRVDGDSRNKRVEVKPYTPESYELEAMRTVDGALPTEKRLLEGLVGMNSEAGEALDIWKKYEFQGHNLDKEAIALELGDALWYLTEAVDALGYSLEEIMHMNIEKLLKRYPDGFDPEKSKNREV